MEDETKTKLGKLVRMWLDAVKLLGAAECEAERLRAEIIETSELAHREESGRMDPCIVLCVDGERVQVGGSSVRRLGRVREITV